MFHNCTTHELSTISKEGMTHYIAQSVAMQRINNFMLGSLLATIKQDVESKDISEKQASPYLKILNLLGQTSSIMENEAAALAGTLKEKDPQIAECGMLGLLARTPIKNNKVSQSHSFKRQATLKQNQVIASQRGTKRKKATDAAAAKKNKNSTTTKQNLNTSQQKNQPKNQTKKQDTTDSKDPG